MKKIVTMLLLPLLLSACGGGNKANDSGGGNSTTTPSQSTQTETKTGKTAELMKGSDLFDGTKWSYDEEYREDVGCHFGHCSIWSDNYYVINGRDIALQYTFQICPEAKEIPAIASTLFVCGLALGDITPDDNAGNKPSFGTEGGDNQKLTFIWKDGGASTITMNSVDSNNLLWFNPYAGRFQKDLNKEGGFSVSVTLRDGQQLTYNFDTSRRQKLTLEKFE